MKADRLGRVRSPPGGGGPWADLKKRAPPNTPPFPREPAGFFLYVGQAELNAGPAGQRFTPSSVAVAIEPAARITSAIVDA